MKLHHFVTALSFATHGNVHTYVGWSG